MVKRLTKHGNSLALVIDKGILELLEIDDRTPLSITTDGKNLIVSPVQKTRGGKSFSSALQKVNKRHAAALKRLAE